MIQSSFLPYPEFPNSRWESMDWSPFTDLVRYNCSLMGEREELVEAGRRFQYERKNRALHLHISFISMEKRLWGAKNFAATRLIKGYTIDYEKIGADTYRTWARMPEHVQGCEEFFYFSTGIWVGSTPQAEVHNEILELTVTPHLAEAVIQFGMPRLTTSFRMFMGWTAQRRRAEDLREQIAGAEAQELKLQRSLDDMTALFKATSDCIFVLNQQGLAHSNAAARQLLERLVPAHATQLLARLHRLQEDDQAEGLPAYLEFGGRSLNICQCIDLEALGEGTRMISLADRTESRRLKAQLLLSEETQQQRVATDVQDGIGQLLAKLVRAAEELEPKLGKELAELTRDVRSLAEECRTLGLRLSSGSITGMQSPKDFHTALGVLAEHYQKLHRFNCTFRLSSGIAYPKPISWTGLFRIIQEAVRNAYRHAGGNQIIITIDHDRIRIDDNGLGFPPGNPSRNGLGLRSMRIRAEQMGLELSIDAHPGGSGTRIEINMPQQTSLPENESPSATDKSTLTPIGAPR